MFISQTTDFHFANYRFSFRKLQILISQTTDFHFANYRFSFRKLQIFISQTTDSHFANYRFSFRKLQISISQTTDFHFVSSHFVSQTTVSPFRIVRSTVGRQNLTRHGVTLISTKKCGARQASEVPKQTRPVKQEKQV